MKNESEGNGKGKTGNGESGMGNGDGMDRMDGGEQVIGDSVLEAVALSILGELDRLSLLSASRAVTPLSPTEFADVGLLDIVQQQIVSALIESGSVVVPTQTIGVGLREGLPGVDRRTFVATTFMATLLGRSFDLESATVRSAFLDATDKQINELTDAFLENLDRGAAGSEGEGE